MRIKVYPEFNPVDLFRKGTRAGLSEEAAEELSYLQEIEIDLIVDESGIVTGAEITQGF